MNSLDEIKLKVKKPEYKIKFSIEAPSSEKVKLDIRRSLNDDYMIYDHPLYDVVLMPQKNKIVTFIKKNSRIDPYPYQDSFFDFLATKGLLVPDTIQSGNVFGSLEASYPINDKIDTLQAFLLAIYKYFMEEIPSVMRILDYEQETEEEYTDPSPEDSTEYGEVPQKARKGTMDPFYTQYYGLLYRI